MTELPSEMSPDIISSEQDSENSLGVTRMEAAFGSGDGDENAFAAVSQGQAEVGTIFNRVYRPWRGTLGPR